MKKGAEMGKYGCHAPRGVKFHSRTNHFREIIRIFILEVFSFD